MNVSAAREARASHPGQQRRLAKSGGVGGDGVGGVAVEAVAGVVVAAGGAGVFAPGVALHVTRGGAGVEGEGDCRVAQAVRGIDATANAPVS